MYGIAKTLPGTLYNAKQDLAHVRQKGPQYPEKETLQMTRFVCVEVHED